MCVEREKYQNVLKDRDLSNLPSQTPGSSRPAAPAPSTGRAVGRRRGWGGRGGRATARGSSPPWSFNWRLAASVLWHRSTARPWAFPARQEEPQFGSLQDLDQRDAGNYITLVLREPRLTEISPLGPWPRRRSRAEAVRPSRRHSAQTPVLARFHDPVKRNKRSGIANIRSITSNYIGNCS